MGSTARSPTRPLTFDRADDKEHTWVTGSTMPEEPALESMWQPCWMGQALGGCGGWCKREHSCRFPEAVTEALSALPSRLTVDGDESGSEIQTAFLSGYLRGRLT